MLKKHTTINDVRDNLPKIFKVKKYKRDDRRVIVTVNLRKIQFDQANNIVTAVCKKLNMKELSSGVNLTNDVRDWDIKMFEDDRDRIAKYINDKCYADLFPSVRQRIAAFKYYKKFWGEELEDDKDELLDSAYRFLNKTPDPNFIYYCAKREKIELMKYVRMLLEIGHPDPNDKKAFNILSNEIGLKEEISTLEAIIAGAMPFLVLYDCGKYDTKKTLIEKIYKARNILSEKDPNNKHIIEMFEDWSSKGKSER